MLLVSIITPTYNHERFIAECIESVLAQNYEHWEMLILDDGSTDNTWSIIQRYTRADPRISAYRQDNKGIFRLSETYNFLLERSKGELIAILEGDDFWPQHKLSVQTEWHRQHTDVLLSYGSYQTHKDRQYITERSPKKFGVVSGYEWFCMHALRQSSIYAVSVVFKKEALEQIGGFQQWQDYPAVDNATYLALSLLERATFYIGSDLTGYWRFHDSQTTRLSGHLLAERNYSQYLALVSIFEQQNPEQTETIISAQEIRGAQEPHLSMIYFQLLRNSLQRKDTLLSREAAKKVWKYGNKRRKLLAAYSFVLSSFGGNLEAFMNVIDRVYKKLEKLKSKGIRSS